MNNDQKDLLTLAKNGASEEKIFQHVSAFGSQLDFEYCAYGLQLPLSFANPKIVLLNNYSEKWRDRYTTENYVLVDPTVAHGRNSRAPFVWEAKSQTSNQGFWNDAHENGVSHGWNQSSITSSGIAGMFTFSRSSEPITAKELIAKDLQLRWMVSAAHESIAQIYVDKLNFQTPEHLTPREVEVLKWTADGKSSQEISDILNVTKHVIDFHIKNSIKKLKAANKTSAVIRAFLMGLLH
jgi:LuxR family transcriptional regulator, quorum-sensing system regulator SolR